MSQFYLETPGGGTPTVQFDIPDGSSVVPDVSGIITFTESAGIDITSPGANTINFAFDITEVPTIADTYTADTGSAAPAANNLNILGGTGVDTSGSGSTITIDFDISEVGTLADTYTADTGSAQPAANNLNIVGGEGIDTSGSTDTITISGEDATDTNKGIASFVSADFSVSSGAVSLVDTVVKSVSSDSGSATPVSHTFTIAGGTGVDTSGSGSTITIDFDVTEVGTIATTYTGDSGSATPSGNNLNILGGPGVTITGAGSTLTVNSVVYTDQTATTLTSDSGTWATAAGAYVLPVSPSEGELVEIVCITTGIVVTANTGQVIFIGGDSTSTAGTATNSAKGDSLWLRYRSTDTSWYSLSTTGVWVLA